MPEWVWPQDFFLCFSIVPWPCEANEFFDIFSQRSSYVTCTSFTIRNWERQDAVLWAPLPLLLNFQSNGGWLYWSTSILLFTVAIFYLFATKPDHDHQIRLFKKSESKLLSVNMSRSSQNPLCCLCYVSCPQYGCLSDHLLLYRYKTLFFHFDCQFFKNFELGFFLESMCTFNINHHAGHSSSYSILHLFHANFILQYLFCGIEVRLNCRISHLHS